MNPRDDPPCCQGRHSMQATGCPRLGIMRVVGSRTPGWRERAVALTHAFPPFKNAAVMRWFVFTALLLALLAVCPRMSADDRPTSGNRSAHGVSHDPSGRDEP